MSAGHAPPAVTEADTYAFDLSADVAASTTASAPAVRRVAAPYDGRVAEVLVKWPDGVSEPLGVRLETGAEVTLLPRPGFGAEGVTEYAEAAGLTHPFPLRVDLAEEDELVAKFTNPTTNTERVVLLVSIGRRRSSRESLR